MVLETAPFRVFRPKTSRRFRRAGGRLDGRYLEDVGPDRVGVMKSNSNKPADEIRLPEGRPKPDRTICHVSVRARLPRVVPARSDLTTAAEALGSCLARAQHDKETRYDAPVARFTPRSHRLAPRFCADRGAIAKMFSYEIRSLKK